MSNRQWHTAAPPSQEPEPIGQENHINGIVSLDPAYWGKLGALERLLKRHGNPQSTPLGLASDLTLVQQYEGQFGPLRDREHPERQAYKMMTALAREDDIRAWLEEWQHQGLDIAPFDKTGFFTTPAPPPMAATQTISAPALRMPNGMIRHLQDTAVGANRGPPVTLGPAFVDPYLGTGLDPTRLSGVVAPYRSTLAPYMACCGQELGDKGEIPPGCWIPLVPGQQTGILVPYQVWFQRLTPTAIWNSIVGGAVQFEDENQIGTAFLDRVYYRELDRRIRELVAAVVPAVVTAQATLLQTQFQNAPVLTPAIRQQLQDLVALVDRYNAPQMGAGPLHETIVDDAFINNRILFLAVGRGEFTAGRLQQEVVVDGVSLPRLYKLADLPNLIRRIEALQTTSPTILSLLEALKKIQSRADNFTTTLSWAVTRRLASFQRLKQAWTRFDLTNFPLSILDVSLGVVITSARLAVETHLATFPTIYNDWLNNPQSLSPFRKTLNTLLDDLNRALQGIPNDADTTAFINALDAPDGTAISAKIAADAGMGSAYHDIALVRRYARFVLAKPGMERAIPSLGTELSRIESDLRTAALAAIQTAKTFAQQQQQQQQQQPNKGVAIKTIIRTFIANASLTPKWLYENVDRVIGNDHQKWERLTISLATLAIPNYRPFWEEAVPGKFLDQVVDWIEDATLVPSQWETVWRQMLNTNAQQLDDKFNAVGWIAQQAVAIPPNTRQALIANISKPELGWQGQGFKFEVASCAYDALFPGLFKIRGQWLQEQIRSAQQIFPLSSKCTAAGALDFHRLMDEEITYMEGRQQGPARCVFINKAWVDCIPSKDPGSTMEDDPRIMLDGLMHFYGLQGQFQKSVYDAPLVINANTEMILIQPWQQQPPFNKIRLHLGANGEFTLLCCFAYRPGHWRAYVREPQSAGTWWLFDAHNIGHDAQGITEGAGDFPRRVIESDRVEEEPGKFVDYVPRGWVYVKLRLPAATTSSTPSVGLQVLKQFEGNRRVWYDSIGEEERLDSTFILEWLREAIKEVDKSTTKTLANPTGQNDDDQLNKQPNGRRFFAITEPYAALAQTYGFTSFLTNFFLINTAVFVRGPFKPEYDPEEINYPIVPYRIIFHPILVAMGLKNQISDVKIFDADNLYVFEMDAAMKLWKGGRSDVFTILSNVSKLVSLMIAPVANSTDGSFLPMPSDAAREFVQIYDALLKRLQ